MASKTGRKVLGGPVLTRPDFGAYLRAPGPPELWQEQMVQLVHTIGRPGIVMVDLWLTSLGNHGGPGAAEHTIAAAIVRDLQGDNSVRVARMVAELATSVIQRNPDFWATPLGILLIHAGALDFDRSFSRLEAARVLGVSPEWIRRITTEGLLKPVGKTTAVTGASLRQVWVERQARYQRLELEQAPAVAALQELQSEL